MNILLLSIVVCLFPAGLAHEWVWLEKCPFIEGQSNFNVEKFLGVWYVIEQYDTDSSCFHYNFTRESETQIRIQKKRQIHLLDNAYNWKNSYEGMLDIVDTTNAAKMRVKWPLNFIGKGNYTVIDTDYETYAGVFDCQNVGLFSRQNMAIMSRKEYIDPIFVDRVKRRMGTLGIDIGPLKKVSHAGCVSAQEADLKTHFDSDSVGGFFQDTIDSIKKTANRVGDYFGPESEADDAIVDIASNLKDQAMEFDNVF